MIVKDGQLRIEVATANLLRGRSDAKVRRDIEVLTKDWKPDIIGLQEAAEYIDLIKRMKGDEYSLALPDNLNRSKRNTAILFNHKELRLVGTGAKLGAEAIPDPNGMPARYINWAHFITRRDGKSIWHYNTHLNPHIEFAGRPRQATTRRVASAKKQLRILSDMVQERAKQQQHSVFWTGDFNIDEHADDRVQAPSFMQDTFDEYGLVSVYDELRTPARYSTKEQRTIDIIGSHKADKSVVALRVQKRDTGSDHDFVLATYKLAKAQLGPDYGGDENTGGGTKAPPKDPTKPIEVGTPTGGVETPYEPLPGDWWEDDEGAPLPVKPIVQERDEGSKIDHTECCGKTFA